MILKNAYVGVAVATLTLAGCGDQAKPPAKDTPQNDSYQKILQTQLLDAKPGDVIEIPAGTFAFDRSLSLTVDGVTIRGAGQDKTILSFKGQISGAEGLLVTANDFTIENLAIEDAKGDALKINEGKNITIRGVRTEWTNGPNVNNGAYGIYPVQTENVLIEDSIAIGASDAGIYVGQSKNIIMRRNRAEYNVAGLEVENSINADVYDNIATNNTGGILVFNLPNLEQRGEQTRVHNNQVFENNLKNFAHKGAIVSTVPAGTGVIVYANDRVEIFDNVIKNNKTTNIAIASYYSVGEMSERGVKASFDPYPEGIYIYGNTFEGGGNAPALLELKALKLAMFGLKGHLPDIMWDGYVNAELPADTKRLCVQNGDAKVINVDGPGGYKNPSMDQAPYDCSLPKLPEVKF
ncbi:MAG: parallel beta-helix domain-containing protein [Robiginitomaculum sp.]|nr:parallel beta-helix domain-containing protein [Robiginitomaculum sp.]